MILNQTALGEDITHHIMALVAPADSDTTTPEETADMMRDFNQKFKFISDYTTKISTDNEAQNQKLENLNVDLESLQQKYSHLEAEFVHSQSVIKDKEENLVFVEKGAEKQGIEIEKRERKNRLLVMEYTQYKKEALEKEERLQKESAESLEKSVLDLKTQKDENDGLNLSLKKNMEKQNELQKNNDMLN